ncbi:diablo IAP-binding mitochondrial protein-like isoform X2 [Tachypleus tridentatus]|uniref:diablo IAP-binding mitochondrial protein-like isoform X2 n=1 Tax=Tachypleus tridentatus TaxID=6853 RepID=UPI003FCEFD4E
MATSISGISLRCLSYFINNFQQRMLRMCLRSFPRHTESMKFTKCGTVNVCLVAFCSNISEEQKDEKDVSGSSLNPLSHEFLIKQACVCMVESATRVVTHVTQAILDGQEEYIQALEKLLSLMEYNIGVPVNPIKEDDIWQDIIAARSEVQEKNKKLVDLQSKMMSVENLINSSCRDCL